MNSTMDAYATTADLYDYFPAYRQRQDVGFFVEAARQSGGPVLEVGCGTGRVLLPTARAGIEITGLDLSMPMLGVCQKRLAEEPEEVRARVQLVQGDMCAFAIDRTFRLATIPFRPFQHLLTVEDQLACLSRIHNHLERGGRLILDIFNPMIESLSRQNLGEEISEGPDFTMPDGRQVVRYYRVISRDLFNQINHIELIYYVTHPDGRKERLVHAFPMRWLYRFEAEHLLKRTGFNVEHLYADYDKSPFGSKYPGELIFVAKPD
jgi:SAM-dependent methyltransferase